MESYEEVEELSTIERKVRDELQDRGNKKEWTS